MTDTTCKGCGGFVGDPSLYCECSEEARLALETALAAARVEVERLRGLVKQAEHGALNSLGNNYCVWCGDVYGTRGSVHHADCPAFTPEGVVR